MVETLLKRLVFVKNGDMRDLVNLMEPSNSVLDKLGELDCGFDGIGDTFDDNEVCAWFGKEIVRPFEVPADSNFLFNPDFVGRKNLLRFFDAFVFVCHNLRYYC